MSGRSKAFGNADAATKPEIKEGYLIDYISGKQVKDGPEERDAVQVFDIAPYGQRFTMKGLGLAHPIARPCQCSRGVQRAPQQLCIQPIPPCVDHGLEPAQSPFCMPANPPESPHGRTDSRSGLDIPTVMGG